jgi:hypothetical protein
MWNTFETEKHDVGNNAIACKGKQVKLVQVAIQGVIQGVWDDIHKAWNPEFT